MPGLQDVREAAAGFPDTTEEYPFGPGEAVFKAANRKIFVMTSADPTAPLCVTLKLLPDEGLEALALPFVTRAAYVGRFGWVTATCMTDAEWQIARQWIARSHLAVTARSSRRRQG